jgi:nitrogen fixation NifU-like protein
MHDPDGQSKVKGTCGDTMEIFLKFDNERVVDASFQTDGCGFSVVCGSCAAEMAFGKKFDKLFEITGECILAELEGLPKDQEHCAFLAVESLKAAADDYMIKQARKSRD